MKPREEKRRLQTAGETIQAFYPLILCAVSLPLVIKFDAWWAGIALGVILLMLHKTWWTCIFGLMNSIALIAMMLVCIGRWIAG